VWATKSRSRTPSNRINSVTGTRGLCAKSSRTATYTTAFKSQAFKSQALLSRLKSKAPMLRSAQDQCVFEKTMLRTNVCLKRQVYTKAYIWATESQFRTRIPYSSVTGTRVLCVTLSKMARHSCV